MSPPTDLIYLDNNATTAPAPEVVAAMHDLLAEQWGNPSSMHRFGQAARRRVELARASVCRMLGCEDRELVLTSGGTEAIGLALVGSVEQTPARTVLVTSRLEHSAVTATADRLAERGIEIVRLGNDSRGLVDTAELETLLEARADEIALVSIMLVNNETGVIQPVPEIARMCRAAGVRVHTDAAQAAGKMPLDVGALDVDLVSLAGHKLHGPKGVGALYVRRGVRLKPQLLGGPQERERRGGTENTAGIVGFGVACDLAHAWLDADPRVERRALRDRFEAQLTARVPGIRVNGAGAERLWTTSNLAFAGIESEPMLLLLSERNVCASAGAACSSGSLDPSPVLQAMHLDDDRVRGSVRFSFSRHTTDDEIDVAVERIAEVATLLGG